MFIQVHYGDNIYFLINLSKATEILPLSKFDVSDCNKEEMDNDGIVVWWSNPQSRNVDEDDCCIYYGISYNELKSRFNWR